MERKPPSNHLPQYQLSIHKQFQYNHLIFLPYKLLKKAISVSDLGITPNNDGKVIRINVPPLTEERRKEFCKLASKYAEEGKVALRNIRRDAVDKEKKDEKEGLISKDLSRDNQLEIQKFTDKYISLIETKLSEKEKEILKV